MLSHLILAKRPQIFARALTGQVLFRTAIIFAVLQFFRPHFWILDIDALFLYLVASAGFVKLVAGITNGSGYSPTVPADEIYLKTPPAFFGGSYTLDQREILLRERPNLKFIALEKEHPLKVTLSSSNGPLIDLTPYFVKAVDESTRNH